jgi:hypothetical protein
MSMGPRLWPRFIFPDSSAFLAFYLGDPVVGTATAFGSIDAPKFTYNGHPYTGPDCPESAGATTRMHP